MSHAGFLRDHWEADLEDWKALVRALDGAAAEAASRAPAQAVQAILPIVPSLAGLDDAERAIVAFSVRLTLHPQAMHEGDLEPLRSAGFDEGELLDISQVVCCFSYMNRLADAFGAHVGQQYMNTAVELFGRERVRAHLAHTTRQAP